MAGIEGLPVFAGLRLVEDRGVVGRYEALDGEGRPMSVLVLGAAAAADPQQRGRFVQSVIQASVATRPGELPITHDVTAPRPWAASYRDRAGAGVERLLPPARPESGPTPTPPGPTRSASSRTPIFAAVVAVALLLVVGLAATLVALSNRDPVAAPSLTRTLEPSAPPYLGPPPSGSLPEPPMLEGPRPILKDVPPATIVGPSFAPGEDTATFDFPGWPFAFRAPGTWGCLTATGPIPDAYAYRCIDEQNPGDGQRVTVLIRRCPTTCTPAEQAEMNRAWLDEPERAVPTDPSTVVVETPRTEQGTYTADVSHFFSPIPREPLAWQVGVFVESPPETRDEVQKIANDIRAQTP